MFLGIICLLLSATVVADALYYRHLRRKRSRGRRAFLICCIATDALPLLTALVGALSHDNTTAFMLFAMWMLWGWMVAVLPRMLFYLFSLSRLPRLGAAAGLCLAGTLVWGATKGRTALLVNRIEIRSERLPAGFDGFRIVQLSDIHLGTVIRPERELQRIVDSVGALRPDLVVFTGDLVNIRSSELDGRAVRILSGLDAPCGVVSVTGNHDAGTYIKDTVAQPCAQSLAEVVRRQRAMGWRVLEDTTVYLRRNGDSISLSGLSFDPSLRHLRHDRDLPAAALDAVYEGVPRSLYNVTAVHLPQLWEQIAAAGYGDLTLSGHVHGMQLKIRLFGRTFSPAQWLYTRWSGAYEQAGRTLYINDGTGCVAYPMRLGAYPEITLITLKRCE